MSAINGSSPDMSLEILKSSISIVDKAIDSKGQVASLPTTTGRVKSFEDTLGEGIWEDYVKIATDFVDQGQWEGAHEKTRSRLIGRTAQTLINQLQGK